MCGIFALASFGNSMTLGEAIAKILESLGLLQYRGYDSAGLCTIQNKSVLYQKVEGLPRNLKKPVDIQIKRKEIKDSSANLVAVSHTRWATHGKVCVKNAHPIVESTKRDFYVVHNGIVENYRELKEILKKKGYKFKTETDTEVVTALADYFYNMSDNDAVGRQLPTVAAKVAAVCEGSSAIVLISKKHRDQMVSVTTGTAPLFLSAPRGNKKTYYIASDFTPLVRYSTSYIRCPTNTIIYIYNANYKFLEPESIKGERDGITGQILEKEACLWEMIGRLGNMKSIRFREVYPIVDMYDGDSDDVELGAYKYYMEKEILEQEKMIREIIKRRVDAEEKKVRMSGLASRKREIIAAARFIFVGCGTSYHACLATKRIMSQLTGKPCVVSTASQFIDDDERVGPGDVVFFVSQSGETADLINVLKLCKEQNALCVSVTNRSRNTIFEMCDCGIRIRAGIEIAVASTKAYTAQCLTLISVAVYVSQEKGTMAEERKRMVVGMVKLADQVGEALRVDVKRACKRMKGKETGLVIGRGFDTATSMEGALKIKEVTKFHVEGVHAGDLKHGVISLVSENRYLLMIISEDMFFSASNNAYQQIRARGGDPIVICTAGAAEKFFKSPIVVPLALHPALQCIINIIPLQLIAYYRALQLNLDPDMPTNLAKSVTV